MVDAVFTIRSAGNSVCHFADLANRQTRGWISGIGISGHNQVMPECALIAYGENHLCAKRTLDGNIEVFLIRSLLKRKRIVLRDRFIVGPVDEDGSTAGSGNLCPEGSPRCPG